MGYYIKNNITNEYLIKKYGFKKDMLPTTTSKYNLEATDEDGYGVHIWYLDRSVSIILGDHAEYGIAPVPELLLKLLKDKVIEKRKDEDDE